MMGAMCMCHSAFNRRRARHRASATAIKSDPAFEKVDLDIALDARKFVGRAPQQVDEFVQQIATPIRQRYPDSSASQAEVSV